MMSQCEVPWIHLDPLHANRFHDGVAMNGCSDCSSSSSGNSDITDPGSPYSVSSEDSSSSPSPSRATPTTFPKMPPVVVKSDEGGCAGWPWSGESELMQAVSPVTPPELLPASPTTASKCNLKRTMLSISAETKRVRTECGLKTEDVIGDPAFDHRGKITHYYKPQKRPDEKRIPLIKAVTLGFTPFMTSVIVTKGNMPNMPTAPPDKAAQSIKAEPLTSFKCPSMMSLKEVSEGIMAPSKLPDVIPKEAHEAKVETDEKKLVGMAAMYKSGTVPEKMSTASVVVCSWASCSEASAIAVASTPAAPAVQSATPTKPVSNTTPTDRDRIASQSCCILSRVNETRTGVTTDTRVVKVSETVIRTRGIAESLPQELTVNTAPCPSSSSSSSSSTTASIATGPKSPILSVPKSIRFPARSNSKPEADQVVDESSVSCHWTDCSARFDSASTLLEHLHGQHVNSQKTDSFVCLWRSCKVYGRTSCSRSWLERHILSHGGHKPFRCIVDGCGMRYSSQLMLEKHVNWHFKQPETPSTNSSAPRRSVDTTPNKLFKRCGKRLRYRRQPWSARQFDYFDAGIMEGLQYRLILQAEQVSLDRHPGCNVTLQSQVIAQRVQSDGRPFVLLRWFPRNIVDDEWVPKGDFRTTRTVRLMQDPETDDALESLSSVCNSVESTPPSSPCSSDRSSVIVSPRASSSSATDSEDEGPATTRESSLWVLKTAAEWAAAAVGSSSQKSLKSRRKPMKKAAVT